MRATAVMDKRDSSDAVERRSLRSPGGKRCIDDITNALDVGV